MPAMPIIFLSYLTSYLRTPGQRNMSEEKQSSKKEAKKALHKRLKAEKKARKSAKKEEKKALREEKKKRKRSEEANDTATDDVQAKEDKKKKSKTKSDDKKKPSADERKKERAARKAAKKAEQAALLEKVPKVDEHGISYTKIQIRRMTRRAKRGLPPVPTEEEEREMLRQKKLDKEEEEQELAGLLHRSNREDEDEDSGEESEGDGDEDDEVADDDEEDIAGNQEDDDDDGSDEKEPASQPRHQPAAKKAKRSKPVPPDYTCMACQNRHSPAHWIYDCPEKERRPGSNHVKKKLRGLNQPSSCKVFVSGLPFEIKSREVEKYFATSCGKVVHCKLLTFEDTKRCKGQAFVTFEEEESAKKALKMTGEVLDYEPEDGGKKKKKSKGDAEMPKKALTLRVSKVKSRIATGGRKY